MRHLLLSTVFLVLLLGVFGLADVAFFVSNSWWWTLGVLLVGFVLGFAGSVGARRGPRVVLLCTFALLTVSLRWVEWNSRKPFLRDLYSIKPGMDVQQVEAIMGRYLKGTGWPANPFGTGGPLVDVSTGRTHAISASPDGQLEIVDSLIYRHTTEGWADSDWGIVRFREGRVVEVVFSMD